MKKERQKGFTLIEALVVVILTAVLAAIALPNLFSYYKTYQFNNYAAQIEYLVKFAKIYAMEQTTNAGVCVSGTQLIIYDIGTSRGAGICTGTAQRSMDITDASIALSGSGATLDPKGLAIQLGSVCVSYGGRYSRICISRTGVRKDEGTGACANCSN